MPTQEVINAKVALGKAYYIELLSEYHDGLLSGCSDCCDKEKMVCLIECIDALTYNIDDDYTQGVYNKLLGLIRPYSGASVAINPNISIPNQTIVLTSDDKPDTLDIEYDDMTLLGTRYDNTDWAGWNPLMQLNTTILLIKDVDYTLISTGGFILKSDGGLPAIFDGQILRVYNYNIA